MYYLFINNIVYNVYNNIILYIIITTYYSTSLTMVLLLSVKNTLFL